MKLAEQQVHFQRLIDCGGVHLYEEKMLRRWWGQGDELSLGTIVQAKHVALSRILWVCYHLPIPPTRAMHQASFQTARALLDLAEKQHIYVDRRSSHALEKKGEWIQGRISLGELSHAHRRARSAMADLAELARDPQELLLAKALHEASSHDPQTALRTFHYTIEPHPFAEKGELLRRHLLEAIQNEEVNP